MFINFANLNVTWLECEIAYFLKAAFPAMVIPAINAETVEAIAIEMKSPFDAMAIFVNILAYISQIILTYQKKPELSKFININKRQSILKIKKIRQNDRQ